MSNNNLAGFPSFGPRVDTKIIYPTPNTVTFEAGTYLPATLPTSPNVEIPITAENTILPYCEPYKIPLSPVNGPGKYGTPYYPLLIVQIKNNDAVARTVYCRSQTMYGNNSENPFSISVPAGYYACFAAPPVTAWEFNKTDRLWLYAPSSTNVELIAAHRLIFPHNLPMLDANKGVADVVIEISTDSLLGGGACYTTSTSYLRATLPTDETANTVGNITRIAGSASATSGFCYYPSGVGAGKAVTHATNPLYHWQFAAITRIAYTPIL